MSEKRARVFEEIAILVIAMSFVVWSVAFIYRSSFVGIDGKRYFSLFDDAMVSMRYAWNFSHGLGLVWNPGEYVEGYTNLLMTLIMSFSTLIFDKSTAALSIQILGIGLMLGNAYLSMQIAGYLIQDENHQRRSLVRILCFLCVLSYYPLVYWSLMGMETGLLTLLLLLSIFYTLKYVKEQTLSRLILTAIWLGLAFLTRNDSAIFAILIFVFALSETYKSKSVRVNLGYMLGAVCLYGLFIVGQTVFRWVYYGELLPNTYVLKLTGLPISFRIRDGMVFVIPFLVETAAVLIVVLLDLIFNFQKTKLLFGSFVFAAIAYQVYIGGEPWNYWRIVSPTIPVLFVLFVQAILVIIGVLSSTTIYREYILCNPVFPRQWAMQVLVVSLTFIGLVMVNKRFLGEISLYSKPYTATVNEENVNAAIALNQLTKGDATVGVLHAGSIPYYTGRVAIDFLGKSDRHVAQLAPDTSGKAGWYGIISMPGHNKYDLNYSIGTLQPTYVQRFVWGGQDITEWGKSRYSKVEYKGVALFLLKDSPAVYWERVDIP